MKIRSFIAINLPQEIKDYLSEIISELKRKNQGSDIKWVNPEGLHLTLHFLGYLDEQKLEKVKEIISQSLEENPSVEVRLENFNGFPNLNQPRVLFVSCQEIGDRVVQSIQDKIGRQLEKIGVEIDKRPWQMHITLARLKMPKQIRIGQLTDEIRKLRFKVKSIDLMKSELSQEGAKYSIIEKFPLKPSL
ncbi:MAG: RNA 2',3'-cyclic phosphodiesterase [Patescibacteria group bacterium]